MQPPPTFAAEVSTALSAPATSPTLRIVPWPDPVIDALGHDPRSPYVERFWLGFLGPSTTLLLRRIAAGLEEAPAGFDLSLTDTARELGLGEKPGRNSPFVRALVRCCQFDLAQVADARTLAVRRRIPPLNRRQLLRLPEGLRVAHEGWQAQQAHAARAGAGSDPAARNRTRALQLALSLLELGEGTADAERQLLRWRFEPDVARGAAAEAERRHRGAIAARSSERARRAEDGSVA